MLEWSFALDLLRGGGASSVLGSGLLTGEAHLTEPLLAFALAIAAILVAYHGLIRRRVAQTLGELAVAIAMLAAGTWLMLNPAGTVGVISSWSERAALGTLAVAAEGSPQAPGRSLGSHLEGIVATAVEGPWCYLEFGDVDWCRDASLLEPRLRHAASRIAEEETSDAGSAGAASKRMRASARLLREARTNGDVFLALPPDGPQRNSINDERSLLRIICETSEATRCRGPAASEAEFRTNGGTWPRVAGLLLIAAGLLGMLLLFGYVAARLLTAAVMSLLYLLMAPGVVAVPMLGEMGRSLFRGWAGRLLAAVASKLIFAFLLGVLFGVSGIIQGISVLGWWAQWLLLSAFWWTAFLRRHQLLAMPSEMLREHGLAPQHRAGRALRDTADIGRRTIEWRERRRERQQVLVAADVVRAGMRTPAAGGFAGIAAAALPADEQAERVMRAGDLVTPGEAAGASERIDRRAARFERLERAEADAAGDVRRTASLRLRTAEARAEDERDRALLAAAERPAAGADAADRTAETTRLLDRQAALPAASERADGPRRDYPALSSLVDVSRWDYERLAPARRRAVRLEIDRELAARRAARPAGADVAEPETQVAPAPRWREDLPGESGALAHSRRRPGGPAVEESPVMRDARAVAEGRKRQLGIGRP